MVSLARETCLCTANIADYLYSHKDLSPAVVMEAVEKEVLLNLVPSKFRRIFYTFIQWVLLQIPDADKRYMASKPKEQYRMNIATEIDNN